MTTYSLPLVRRKHPDRVRPPRDPLLIASASVLGLIVAVAVVAAVVPFAGDPQRIVGPRLSAPTTLFPLGTDALGRSLLPRLLEGIGTTLVLSTVAVLCTAVISVVLGLVAGYAGGWAREGIMRVVDVLYSFPSIVLAILIAAVIGPGQAAALSSIVLVTVPLMTRMVSSAAMAVAQRDFVTTARISGVSAPVILFRHLLPNVSGTIAVQGTYALSVGILVEGGLSFLGYGVQLPGSSLGLLIQEGGSYMVQAPWLLFAPAIVLVVAILSINLIGDAMRDRLDPRETRSLV
ncbi:ABC transporter permease [Leucobacter sp. OLJS4]|uniref:ABC transporter permease n=1 Tax=unclassified Leucobacter TaxID=2621730 RepID=UPI000C1A5A26|nr:MULTISPECIES: ABC transporter permease [unclassified Leucobacter]PII86673.1 ABC transporter permease [Leucobacter sp. OLCALW19]PII88960.1 ABC transporter permease [Leucobacter sp. OLAS13]PII96049.1 ABC transporter permease [Leucobacter sp. OLTLW20]PII99323.1 ABC transporter permease [Leucobacter sp. OLDS2]PIJ01715.1 ABC transporter permease [Leucobacter sp. OLCS4]